MRLEPDCPLPVLGPGQPIHIVDAFRMRTTEAVMREQNQSRREWFTIPQSAGSIEAHELGPSQTDVTAPVRFRKPSVQVFPGVAAERRSQLTKVGDSAGTRPQDAKPIQEWGPEYFRETTWRIDELARSVSRRLKPQPRVLRTLRGMSPACA
jgi:hypothetical protein